MGGSIKQSEIGFKGAEGMTDQIRLKNGVIRLRKGDITEIDIESFVFYAQHDMQLGSGFGTAISIRGGPSIQEELKAVGTVKTTEAVVSAAGELKAKYIIHAVGPRFQEEDTEIKLETTILNSLKQAEDRGIASIAFPAMGSGFYGIPLEICARITIDTIANYLNGDGKIKDIVICLLDTREYKPFRKYLAGHGQT